MIIVLASVGIGAGHLPQALVLGREHCARSRLEPGCLSHGVHQDADDESRLVFVERWADMAALQQHFAVPASRAFVKALSALAAAPAEMTIYEATPRSG